jgi:transposase
VLTQKKDAPLKKILNEVLPNDNLELLFYDEAFFCRESTVTRGWYPRGSKAEIPCPMTFEKVGTCGAVSPRNGSLYSLAFDGFDSNTFIYYLKWLLRVFRTKKKIVLVLDNASSHKSHKVNEFVATHKKRLELLFLPAYSPDLNPIERVWKHLRYHVTHNVYFETLETLENAIISYLKEHAKPNVSLKSLCCIN